jgi:hypothetical protein
VPAATLTDKERIGLRFHSRPLSQPSLDCPYLVPPERVRRGQSVFQPGDMQHAALNIHVRQLQPAGLRHAQAMPKHQQQQTAVAGRVAAALRNLHELFDFGKNQVFSLVHHFVQCSGIEKPRNASISAESVSRH